MKKIFIFISLVSISFISCEKDFETSDLEKINNTEKLFMEYNTEKNPFSIQKMNDAVISLQREGRLNLEQFPEFSIRPTHLYLKYKPTNEEQEGLIKSDSTYFVFDYPLHLNEQDEELYLQNRKPLAEDADGIQIEFPTYYTAIAIENISNLSFEFDIIDELYIPEEDPYFEEVDRDGNLEGLIENKEELFENLIHKAFVLTGREEELIDEENSTNNTSQLHTLWFIGKKWTPSGQLKIWDSSLGRLIPLKSAQVLMRQFFTIRQGITDSDGKFKTGTVRGKAKYLIQWERHHYSIRTNTFFQAESKGPNKKKSAWNHTIIGGSEEYYGTIHHAAYLYYYTNRFGFASPPTNGFGKKQMKIAAKKQNGASSHVNARTLYFGSQVSIKEWGRKSEDIFGTTIHELTHAAHFNFDKYNYNSLVQKAYITGSGSTKEGAKRLLETWGTTAEIYLTNHWYRFVLGQNDYKFKGDNLQLRLINNPLNSDHKYYTSAGNDMIEHFNQGAVHGAGYPVDRVSGYTPDQLQSSLHGATHWSGWKDNIKSQHTNSTSIYLDELFNNW